MGMCAPLLVCSASAGRPGDLPSSWLRKWTSPPAEDRPLQIIHGIRPSGTVAPGMGDVAPAAAEQGPQQDMRHLRDLGLGGIVCNVLFENYLRSKEAWNALVDGVRACRDLGMVVWIYDEKGYPSGSAGGLVLEGNPEFEAQELAFDPSRPDPFIVRPSYEFTHAANNYHAARRYANLLDDRAVRKFIALTHQAYRRRLGPDIGTTVRAFFTDEPSLLAVNLGQLPESVRRNVPIQDPPDPGVRPLPAVPWVYDLPERYQERYRENLLPIRRSLFEGNTPRDREVRRRFWTLVAHLISERYFGILQQWCGQHRVASSGHNLWEEALMHHPALYGNALKALGRMDIPGLDELSSTPAVVLHGHWMTAVLPGSAAILSGGRRVFTEVSDFSEKMAGRGPASLDMMRATAGWQAAFGVTEFALYYRPADRSAEDYRAYCDFVGRLNAILKPGKPEPDVLLYYPIRDLMEEYIPVAEPLNVRSQSERAQRIVASFNRLGGLLTRSQTPFCLVDEENLLRLPIRKGCLMSHGHRFRAVVLPDGVELSPEARRLLGRFQSAGGRVVHDGTPQELSGERLRDVLKPEFGLEPACESIVLGKFRRDGRTVLVLANVGAHPWSGHLSVTVNGPWQRLAPADGSISTLPASGGRLALSLGPLETILLVAP